MPDTPDQDNLPGLTYALIDYLDAIYPERTPDPSWSHDKIMVEIGKREVVRFLLEKRKDEQETVLNEKA